jgi:hypothetical protein
LFISTVESAAEQSAGGGSPDKVGCELAAAKASGARINTDMDVRRMDNSSTSSTLL